VMVGLDVWAIEIHGWAPKLASLGWIVGLASWMVGPELAADCPKLSLNGSVALVNLWME